MSSRISRCRRCGLPIIFAEVVEIHDNPLKKPRRPVKAEKWVIFDPDYFLHQCQGGNQQDEHQ